MPPTSAGPAPDPPPVDRTRLAELRAKTATVREIRLYPVKSLEGLPVAAAPVQPGGGFQSDRRYAFFSKQHGGWIRAKDFPQLIRIHARFDLPRNLLELTTEAGARAFDLTLEQPAFSDWMSDYLQHPVVLKEAPAGGFFDDSKKDRYGVSLISTATLQRVCAWFPGLALDELRRRLRTNIEVDGVEPFWEEALIGQTADGAGAPTVRIGAARFTAALACPRCSVPERDSYTADPDPAFRARLSEMRVRTHPRFLEPAVFKTSYSLAIRLVGAPPPPESADSADAPDSAEHMVRVGDSIACEMSGSA